MPSRRPGLTAAEHAMVDRELTEIGGTLLRLGRLLREAYGEPWLDKLLVEYRRIERIQMAVADKQVAADEQHA